jgi:folate-dependent phosphoribosylglycinamide formyltransferase PurN
MRLLSKEFLAAFPRRILNIHPSLLPCFPDSMRATGNRSWRQGKRLHGSLC